MLFGIDVLDVNFKHNKVFKRLPLLLKENNLKQAEGTLIS